MAAELFMKGWIHSTEQYSSLFLVFLLGVKSMGGSIFFNRNSNVQKARSSALSSVISLSVWFSSNKTNGIVLVLQ